MSSEHTMKPITDASIVEKVIQSITKSIQQGRFKRGQKLPSEFELMEELKISRTPLREAMKIMAAMGIVTIKRGNGTYVNETVNPEMFDSLIYSLLLEDSTHSDVIELRQLLDEMVLHTAIKKCQLEQIEKLESLIAGMRKHFAAGDISEAANLDVQFHYYLVDCCQNPLLSRIVKGVYSLFETSIEKNIRTEKLFAQADTHHQNMVAVIKTKDDDRVSEVVAESLKTWRQNIQSTPLQQD